ncbi:MAG: hypothetical protein LBS39_00170 [Campylobacteraceae bacterium]|jgi:FtsZ-binding cell division protein ZapB|nr:hypothetical protein [Campylobacteraceae bacterium]
MTVTLKNVDFKILKVIESLKILKSDMEIIKEPNDKTIKAIKEAEEIAKKPHLHKSYKTWEEAKKAILDEV